MTPAATHCAKCGKPRDPAAAYCEYCGASAADAPPGGQAPGVPSSPPPAVAQPPRPGTGHPHASTSHTQRGFFASLFDLSFTSLVTTKIIKALYLLSMLLIGLAALAFVIAAFHQSSTAGLFVLVVVAPIVSLLYLIYARVVLELVIVLFRIMENTGELAAQGRRDP
jgi:Domain of unknown function (DUF4282)